MTRSESPGLLAGMVAAVALAGSTRAGNDDAALTDLDRKVVLELTASKETPRAVFHHRPGIDAKTLDEDVAANVAAFASLEKTLGMKYKGRVHFFLYGDVAEMTRLTGAADGTGAFSTGTVSVHQPRDFRGVHELTHIFALQFERPADTSGPDLFTVEGLATWLAESDESVPIHAWAAAYAKANLLPASIRDFRATFPSGAAAGVHPYHVAGSFVGHLCEKHGIAKVKQWYVDSTEAHRYFGKSQAQLEREWREQLLKLPLDPAHEKHVLRKLGIDTEPMPAAWSTAKGTPLFDGKTLAGLEPEDASKWSVKDGMLVGSHDGAWTHLATAKEFGAKSAVRARLRLASGNAIKVRLGDREAIFAVWSSYATAGEGFTGNERVKIPVGSWIEVVVANDGGRARVYLDGRGVFDLPGLWAGAGEGAVALAVERGVVEVKEWVVFEP